LLFPRCYVVADLQELCAETTASETQLMLTYDCDVQRTSPTPVTGKTGRLCLQQCVLRGIPSAFPKAINLDRIFAASKWVEAENVLTVSHLIMADFGKF